MIYLVYKASTRVELYTKLIRKLLSHTREHGFSLKYIECQIFIITQKRTDGKKRAILIQSTPFCTAMYYLNNFRSRKNIAHNDLTTNSHRKNIFRTPNQG